MISVVMPVYNCERYVGEAIQSILKQSFGDFEFIVVDDGSTDSTAEIVLTYGRQDARIRVISRENGGISRAINEGAGQAKYDWIAIMHADDIALPHRLEKQVRMARNNPKVIAWGSYAYHIDEKGKTLGLSRVGPTTEEEFYTRLRAGEPILLIHTTALIWKEAFRSVGGYNPLFQCSEDLEFFDRLSTVGPLLTTAEPLALYRIHASSNTMRRFREQKMEVRYIYSRQHARSQGKPLPTWKEFTQEYMAASALKRLRRQTEDLAQFCYRKFAVSVSGKQYLQAFQFLLLSALLDPKYTLSKAWNQRFSKSARSLLNARRCSEAGN